MQNNNQVREFISALTGSEHSEVTFQAFFDPKGVEPPTGVYPETWTSTLDDSIDFIDYKQSQQCGIYMCVNGTDGQGREVDNIIDLRVMFVDFDGMEEPEWSLQPHLIQSRDKTHGHAFWLIDAGDLTHEEWTILQKQLSIFYSSDSQVIDPCRVIRLPGSLHFKDPSSPQMYSIDYNDTGNGYKYSIDDIRDCHTLSPELDAELNEWVVNREANQSGAGYDNNSNEIKKFQAFVTHAAHPAQEGSGSHELFRVACFAHDHGIDLEHSIPILWEHYNPRCLPPWEDEEREQFEGVCTRAYKYPSSAAGCKAAKAQFLLLPPLEEPKCGWENQAAQFNHSVQIETEIATLPSLGDDVDRNHRISIQNAAAMSAQVTLKSSHYDFGLVYDGLKHDGLNLIKSSKQFYRFTGKSWKEVEDDVIKADIQRTFAAYKPANKFTSGVYAVVCDLVNHESIDNGLWLTDEDYDTSNLAVFQNGIVDLSSKELTLSPHTYEFFTLNELSYDFDPEATCQQWHEFLTSIWGDDQKLKEQLQEWFGYCLVNDISLHKFAILMGKSRAGKGVITDILSEMIGDKNTCSPSLTNLAKDSALEEMSSKSLTIIPDAHSVHPTTRDLVLSNFKAITGGDKISFHRMYKGSDNKLFLTKILMITNNVPEFNDPSGALVNRALIFPFPKHFEEKDQDHGLRKTLLKEVSGITQWAIEGLRRLRINKGIFTESDSGKREKEELRKDMFPLAQYVERVLVIEKGAFTLLEDMYNAYRLWAASEGVRSPMLKTGFNKTLRNSALPIQYESATAPGYHGVTVKSMMCNSNIVAMRPNP